MERDELSNYLYKHSLVVEPYPELVAPVPQMLNVTAFFPGGHGLWLEEETDKFPSILIFGQDFSTEDYYKNMLDKGCNEINGPTWRNLRKLFNEVNINLQDCFFSNVFMGLRKTERMTGRFPGFKDKTFVNRNAKFLLFQIETIKPKLIITLGRQSSDILSGFIEDLSHWMNGKALSVPDIGYAENVIICNHKCTCVALEHPSMRNSNIRRREYKDFIGNEAEVEMLRNALGSMDY